MCWSGQFRYVRSGSKIPVRVLENLAVDTGSGEPSAWWPALVHSFAKPFVLLGKDVTCQLPLAFVSGVLQGVQRVADHAIATGCAWRRWRGRVASGRWPRLPEVGGRPHPQLV